MLARHLVTQLERTIPGNASLSARCGYMEKLWPMRYEQKWILSLKREAAWHLLPLPSSSPVENGKKKNGVEMEAVYYGRQNCPIILSPSLIQKADGVPGWLTR